MNSLRSALRLALAIAVLAWGLACPPAHAFSIDPSFLPPTPNSFCFETFQTNTGFRFNRDNTGAGQEEYFAEWRDGNGTVLYALGPTRRNVGANAYWSSMAFIPLPDANPLTFTVRSVAGNGFSEQTQSWVHECTQLYVPVTLTGLGAGDSVRLRFGSDTLTLSSNQNASPTLVVGVGSAYTVTIDRQASFNTCGIVANGSGTMTNSGAPTVVINCIDNQASGACGSANGVATAASPAANLCGVGFPSAVTGSGPFDWTCAGGRFGTAASCSAPLAAAQVFPLGGTLGLMNSGGSITLANGSQTLTLTANGPFTIPPGLAAGTNYNVTITSQPAGQTCTVSNGQGTMSDSGVNNITVSCLNNPVNGVCGSANGVPTAVAPSGPSLCSSGLATAVSGSGPFTWDCRGNGRGTSSQSCSAPLAEAPSTVQAVPMLGEWGLMLLGLAAAGLGMRRLGRRG